MTAHRSRPADDVGDRGLMFSGPMVRALWHGRKTQTRRLLGEPMPSRPAMDNVHPSHTACHAAPYLDAYCGRRRTPANPRGMGPWWCWWTRDDRPGPQVFVGHVPGQRLWVKERHALTRYSLDYETGGEESYFPWDPEDYGDPRFGTCAALHYEADGEGANPSELYPVTSISDPRVVLREAEIPWRSPRCMWRWASRLTLTIADIRLQPLHDLSDEDALAEGVIPVLGGGYAPTEDGLVQLPDGTFDVEDEDLPPHTAPTPRAAYALLWDRIHGRGAWSSNPWVTALTFAVERRNIDAPIPAEAAVA